MCEKLVEEVAQMPLPEDDEGVEALVPDRQFVKLHSAQVFRTRILLCKCLRGCCSNWRFGVADGRIYSEDPHHVETAEPSCLPPRRKPIAPASPIQWEVLRPEQRQELLR